MFWRTFSYCASLTCIPGMHSMQRAPSTPLQHPSAILSWPFLAVLSNTNPGQCLFFLCVALPPPRGFDRIGHLRRYMEWAYNVGQSGCAWHGFQNYQNISAHCSDVIVLVLVLCRPLCPAGLEGLPPMQGIWCWRRTALIGIQQCCPRDP